MNKIIKEINKIGTYTKPTSNDRKKLRELIAMLPISKYDRIR